MALPLDLPNLEDAICPWNRTVVWVEADDNSGSAALTQSLNDGDFVGGVDNQGIAADQMYAQGSSRRATWQHGQGRAAWLRFGGSPARCMIFPNSTRRHQEVHTGGNWWMGGFLKMDGSSDASGTHNAWGNMEPGATGKGHILQKLSTNKIRLLIGNGTGTFALNYSTTATVNSSSNGGNGVCVQAWGEGTSGAIRIGDTTESFTITSPMAANEAASALMTVGANPGGTTGFAGCIDGPYFCSSLPDSTLRDAFAAWTPAMSSDRLARALSGNAELLCEDLSNLHTLLDFSNLSRMFQDDPATVPVEEEDDPLRRYIHFRAPKYLRDVVAPSDGVRPLYKANIGGGLGAVLFNGVDSQLNIPQFWGGGARTWVFIFDNLDDVHGSHFLNPSAPTGPHWVQTGRVYASNGPGGSRIALHTTVVGGGDSSLNAGSMTNQGGQNLTIVRQNGQYWSIDMCGQSRLRNFELPGIVRHARIGPNTGVLDPQWWMHGRYKLMAFYNTYHSDANVMRLALGEGHRHGVQNLSESPYKPRTGGKRVFFGMPFGGSIY